MRTRNVWVLIAVMVLAQACLTQLARGQVQTISQGSNQSIDSDGAVRSFRWMNGQNAVVRQMYNNIDIYLNDQNQVTITASVQIDGGWGDPNAITPSQQLLIDHGMRMNSSQTYSRFSYDGVNFDFSVPVQLDVTSEFSLNRYPNWDTGVLEMFGHGNATFEGRGIYPIESHTSVSINYLNIPLIQDRTWTFFSWNRYVVTVDMTQTPTPGTASLGFMAMGILARRRRR